MQDHHPATLDHDALSRLAGYTQPAALEAWCDRQGIRYFRGRRGIWTTLDAVNQALGIGGDAEKSKVRF